MAIEIISAEDVLKIGRTNRERGYPAHNRDEHRLRPFAEVSNKPKFTFAPDAKVFTAGSCFARNIERSLRKMGYDITSSGQDFYNPFPDRQAFQRFNKYTVHSILNEIEWALGERTMDVEKLLCPTKDGFYCDTQTSGDGLSASLEEMVKFRETYNAKFAPVADADVVMLTLGFVECWHDTETGEYLNRFPGATALRHNPGRFSLHVLDYEEIYETLCQTYDVIARHNPDFKMLVTVSPVPLDRTFRDMDVLMANTYSKSVQRAAVEAFVNSRPADYFPSYEIVTLTDMKYAWSDHDFRHVRGEMVDRLMGRVLERYTDITERQSAQKTRGYVTAYLAARDVPKAATALAEHVDKFGLSLDLMLLAADVELQQGQVDAATTILRDLIIKAQSDPDTTEALFDATPSLIQRRAGVLLELALRQSQISDNTQLPEMEKLRARKIVNSLILAYSDDGDLGWLQNYLDRSGGIDATNSQKQNDEMFLIEAAALARLRGLSGPDDLAEAEAVVAEALDKLKFSEALQFELALLYRKHDQLETALALFDQVGRLGGAKAVAAVKHALPLARRLKKHQMVAELAETVARALR